MFGPALIIIAGVVLIFLSFAYKGLQNTPDSCSYLDAAENLAKGNGLTVDMVNFSNINSSTIYASWPPFYPVLLSLPILAGTTKFTAAIMIQVLSLSLLLVSLFSLTYSIRGKFAAYTSLSLMASLPSLYYIAGKAWSELTFTALSVTALLFLYLYNKKSNLKYIFLAGIFAGLAAFTRMNGVAIIASGLVIIAITHRDLKKSLKPGLIFFILGSTPLAVWLLRTIYLTGYVTGAKRNTSQSSIIEIILFRIKIIYFDFFAPHFSFIKFEKNLIVSSLIPICLSIIIISIIFQKNFRNKIQESWTLLLAIVMLFIAMISALAMLDLPTFDSRYTFLMYPFAVALMATLIPSDLSKIKQRILLLIVLVFMVSHGYYSMQFITLKQHSNPPIGPFEWQQYVSKMPEKATIFSNYQNLICLYSSRAAKRVPTKDKEQITVFLTKLHKKDDYIILFPNIRPNLAFDELLPQNNKGLLKMVIQNEKFLIIKFLK